MILSIQDPKDPTGPSLQESLLGACQDAIRGGAAFAFVSQGGVKLLLKDKIFKRFAASRRFDLIVGVDGITNPKALTALAESREELPKLDVRVFHHTLRGPLFHPKFCWFRHKSGGILIAGSGNLTARGLRGNWEAFTVSALSSKGVNEVEQKWKAWTASHAGWLKSLDDADVLARAALNIIQPVPGVVEGAENIAEGNEPEIEDEVAAAPAEQSDLILAAEIPRSGDRWNQANFDLNTFREFFGLRPGKVERIILQHTNADGTLGTLESRPGVSVKSQNYRLELDAAAGLPYPDNGRPICVFVRVATRTFKYRLLMPEDPGYAAMAAFLAAEWEGRADRMRRVSTDFGALREAWPDSPL